jgi:hypothetical protein
MSRPNQPFSTIKTEGLLLPPELIARVADLDAKLPGIRPEEYNLPKGERINEATNRSWNRLTSLWTRFREELEGLSEGDAATGLTRDRWLLPLFDELGYGRLQRHAAFEIDGKSYAISHLWGHAPIHLVGAGLELDKRAPGQVGAAQASPHGLVQQFLNRTDDHLWAFVSNGLELRILRDNVSLTRQAYVELDLAAMMDGELYSDFRLLWLLCHQSRVESERPTLCWLEKWTQEAREQGARALERLREGVEKAISALGSGFLAHPANTGLHARLASGELEAQDYYRQLLRLVYRLIFLFVAEDRDLLLTGDDETARRHYQDYYSTARLRRIAHRLKGSRHEDLFEGLKVVMDKLHADGCTPLALPALGSFLWDPAKLPDVAAARIRNRDFLEAVRALAFVEQERTLRPIDYRNLGPEELGSVYESLLELHPELHWEAATFELKTAGGSERKTTGSYYTHEALIQESLNSGLDPLLDRAASQANPEQAILSLKVCDPAVGSGHFLVAAVHRIARRLAAARSGDEEPAPAEITLALRDVVSHCLYGVDINEMAVELCKVSLWMTAMTPGRPLSFLDHRIRCGNSLLGATPALIAKGIPDEAFKPVAGDDKDVCQTYRAQNKRERESGMGDLFRQGVSSWSRLCKLSDAVSRMGGIRDEDITGVREQAAVYASVVDSDECRQDHLVANAWCAAFMWEKRERPEAPHLLTEAAFRRLEETPDRCADWMLAEVKRLTARYRFFHWHLEFPDVFRLPADNATPDNPETGWNSGFDLVLGNPPWDTLSPDTKEFFSTYDPQIRFEDRAGQAQIMDRLLTDPSIANRWETYQRDLYAQVHFFKNSGRYRLFAPGNLGKGDFNIFRMFVESALQATAAGGYAAQITPEGLYNGANSMAIRKELFEGCRLDRLLGFENAKETWFAGIDSRTKFTLYAAAKGGRTERFHAAFNIRSPEQLAAAVGGDWMEIPVSLVSEFSPDALAVMEFSSQTDIDITAKMYARWPKFGDPTAGPPFREYQAEVHMGNDRHLFTEDTSGLPVYEGRMVAHYDHRAKGYKTGRGRSADWEEFPFVAPGKRIQPQWRVLEDNLPSKLSDRPFRYRVAFCNVASPTNERSLVAALIPPRCVAGDVTPTIMFDRGEEWAYLPWLSVANSFLMDYVLRQKVALHVTYSLMDSLPFPRLPIEDPRVAALALRVLQLTCTGTEMIPFWNAMAAHGWVESVPDSGPAPGISDPDRRLHLIADIEAIIARDLFSLTADELDYVLETFPIVKRRDIQKYGDYRTKLLILDCYERLNSPKEESLSFSDTESTAPV